jgi:glycogen debranching enzyme
MALQSLEVRGYIFMKRSPKLRAVFVFAATVLTTAAWSEEPVPRFEPPRSGLELERPARAGRFFVVAGRRSAVFGYENRPLEAWAYPLKLVDDLRLSFRLHGYPLEIEALDALASVAVRPEATIFTYSHAAFTVREIVFTPVDEPGVVILLDVDAALPMTVTASFRPRLRPMWPAGLMTPSVEWDEKKQVYFLTEESKRFAAVVGTPGGTDLSVMPYQEEPKDVPLRLSVEVARSAMRQRFVPIVLAGSVNGRDEAKATYDRLLGSARALYEANVAHFRDLDRDAVSVKTPDPRLDAAFAWAKVGIDKGVAKNPLLGTGLVAGFRTSGESERPGYAWLFGRDALWTALATTSYGDHALTRTALDFLGTYQRDDGKIPHEISQSASLLPWFRDYAFPWNSADASPLFVIAHGDYFRAAGDRAFLKASWPRVLKAYRFTAATDSDGNGLVENSNVGDGWVEGGPLHPAHEEIYMQGVWIEASRAMAEMADAMKDAPTAATARAWADKTRAATEKTYWLADRGYYAFATAKAREKLPEAEPGPNRPRRQARMEALAKGGIVDEDTVLPAVPLWWRTLDDARAQSEIDHLGGGSMETDWGTRILADKSALYDPLSYHYGSVWPLFTGWTSMAAYRYGRPAVGYQALMANALLTFAGGLGSVTELLSGDFQAPFGRSSHHQIWSQAMVVTPLLRGLFGLEVRDEGATLAFAPQLPPDWPSARIANLVAAGGRCDLAVTRVRGRLTIDATRRGGRGSLRLVASPAFPLDAHIRSVSVGGRSARFDLAREGDVQRAITTLDGDWRQAEVVFEYDEGTEAYVPAEPSPPGARSEGLRLLRARAEGGELRLALEGLGGRRYRFFVRSSRPLRAPAGVTAKAAGADTWELEVAFDGPATDYVRRDVALAVLSR